jgi:hypothetical protein
MKEITVRTSSIKPHRRTGTALMGLLFTLAIAPVWMATSYAVGKSDAVLTTASGTKISLVSFSEGLNGGGGSGGRKRKKANHLTVKYKYGKNAADPLKAEIAANHIDTLKVSVATDGAATATVYTFDNDLIQSVRTTTKGGETVVTVVFDYGKVTITSP